MMNSFQIFHPLASVQAWEVSHEENEAAILMFQEVRAKRHFGKKLDHFPVHVKIDKVSFRGEQVPIS